VCAYAWLYKGLARYTELRTNKLTESTLLLEASAAALMFTFPWLLARMGAHVLLERLFCGKHYATDIALYWLVPSVSLQVSLQLALLREWARPYTTVPRTAEPILALLQVFYMLTFAVILKFLVAPKCFGAENTIFTKPLAGEVSLSIHGLVVSQLGLRRGGVGRHGKNCIVIQGRAAVTTGEVSIVMI
jgi:hypothetical protein